jgi:hypothetical protein
MENWVLIFALWTAATSACGTDSMDGFKDRDACVEMGLRLEEANPVKWFCIEGPKMGKAEPKRSP